MLHNVTKPKASQARAALPLKQILARPCMQGGQLDPAATLASLAPRERSSGCQISTAAMTCAQARSSNPERSAFAGETKKKGARGEQEASLPGCATRCANGPAATLHIVPNEILLKSAGASCAVHDIVPHHLHALRILGHGVFGCLTLRYEADGEGEKRHRGAHGPTD